MKGYIQKITVILTIISIMMSSTNMFAILSIAEDINAIISYVDINFVDPETEEPVTEVKAEQSTRMSISFGVASNIDTEQIGIRIDLDNDNFYFTSFSPNGDSNGATYNVIVTSNGESKVRTAVLHIQEDGTRYITIDELEQGETVHMNLDGYFKNTVTENEKLNVSVNGTTEATLTAKNVENQITVSNDKSVSKDSISFSEGDKEGIAANFPITYNISSTVTIPDYWKNSEKIESVTINDTLTFPEGMYITYDGNFQISDYISLGSNSVLTATDFSPELSSDGTKVVGITLNKNLTGTSAESYLANGEEIRLKYNENLIIEKDGTIKNTLSTTYKTTNYEDTATPVEKTTSIDVAKGPDFTNSSKTINWTETTSSTSSKGYFIEGDTITYEFSVQNQGDKKGDISITDIIPQGTTLVSARSSNTTNIDTNAKVTVDGAEKNAVVWNFTDVEPLQTVTGKITLKISENSDLSILNNIYENTNYNEPIATSPEIKVQTKKPATFENASKWVSSSDGKNFNNGNGYIVEGETVTYEFSIKNTGDVAGDISITDIIPEGTTLVSATSDYTKKITTTTITVGEENKDAIIWNFENVGAEETVTGKITLKVSENESYKIINNIYTDTDYTTPDAISPEISVETKRPELEISKTAESSSGKYSNPGDTVKYTITITNNGSADITTSIVDKLPESLENITCTNQENATIEDGKITWNDVTITVGDTVIYEVSGTVKEGTTGTITNTAIVDETGEYEKQTSVSTEVFDEQTAINAMELSKSVDKTSVRTGDTIVYTIKLRNSGNDFNIEDLAEGKITITDIIPEGLKYLENAYYILPWQSSHLTDGISYDENTRTLTCNIESSVYNTFASHGELFLHIPCEVIAEIDPNADVNIDNTASSSTLSKDSNTVTVTIPKPTGINLEKYVYEVYDNKNKDNLLYKNNLETNSNEINLDIEDGYLVTYRIKISNKSDEELVFDDTNGSFSDVFTGLDSVVSGVDWNMDILDSNKDKLGSLTIGYWGGFYNGNFSFNLSGYKIPANDYIVVSYDLVIKSGVTEVTNIVSNSEVESEAQKLTDKPAGNKQVAIVDKTTEWGNITTEYLKSLDFQDSKKVTATQLENKYLIYKVHVEAGLVITDTFTLTDNISDNLNFVTDLNTISEGRIYGTGPILAIVKDTAYSWNPSYEYIINAADEAPTIEIEGQKLTATFTTNQDTNALSMNFDIYYLVEMNQELLQEMLTNMDNSIDVDDVDLINTANIKSSQTDENSNPKIDITDTTTINVNDGILYPGLEKEYMGFFAPGDTKVDSEGNVQLSNGSANAGAHLVWKVTVKNENKESAKDLRNYKVKELLPDPYIFDSNYLDETYLGAKYYPSILIYDEAGNAIKTLKGKNFILPEGYEDSSELIWDFTGEEYYLKPGYKMEITFATKVKVAGSYGAFLNTAQLIVNSDVDKESVDNGVILDESTIESTAFANIYSHMTTSYKKIEYNPDLYDADYEQPAYDTGVSKKDSDGVLDNYVQGHQGELVKYTLNITNESKVNVKDLVIIDRLPYVGDIGVIAKYERDSAFEVKYDSFIKAEIYDTEGNYSRTVPADNIVITFSEEKSAVFDYSAGDWTGIDDVATWTSDPTDNTVNVRFAIAHDKTDDTTYLKSGETLKIFFYGRIPEYVENTGSSNIAWNNFAYGYKAYNANTDKELSNLSIAEPAKVGVWVEEEEITASGEIQINKKYNANSGNTTAYFVLYKYNEEYDLTDENSQEYQKYSSVISINVKAGQTSSYIFENLPAGTSYKIYETDKDGNILDAQNNDWYTIDGQGTTVSLAAGENKQVTVTNTALPEFKGSVKISKNVQNATGESVTTGDYTFVLKNDVDEYVYLKDGVITTSTEFVSEALITVSAGKSVTIEELAIGKYKVYEVDENGTNVNSVEEIGYTVEFSPSNSFEISRAEGNKEITATNTLEEVVVETVEVSGTKTWNDNNNQDGKRPESITIRLLKNGTEVESKTVSEADGWKYSFTGLEKYDENNDLITYTITEDEVADYETIINGFDVTNTHIPETTEISVEKVWDDNNNQDGKRPTSIKVQLKANGSNVGEEIELTDSKLTHTWTDLAKYEDGQEIEYIVIETTTVEGYTTTSLVEGNKTTITNKYTPGKTSITVNKVWADENNQDGKRPTSIKVQLKADGALVEKITLTAGEDNEWSETELTYTWTDLDEYKDGSKITYTVEEIEVADGYEASSTTEGNTTTITNTYETEVVSVSGTKTWDDSEDQDGIRPESITVNLLANGTEVQEVVVTSANNWTYEFTNLDKFSNGVEIVYTVTEDEVEGYTSSVNGYNITNTHTPETTEVSVEKVWDDYNNQDKTRPESIEVQLKANGSNVGETVELTDSKLTHTWTNLPKNKNGQEIEYTVIEVTSVDGYTTETKQEGNKVTITNTYRTTTSVEGTKTWVDYENADNTRPNSITVNLLKNGEKIDSKSVTEEDGWKFEFTNLEKYDSNNNLITYTITEDEVVNYTTVINGYDITNTYTATISVEGVKTWVDYGNIDNTRPESITINLIKDGEIIDSKVVTADIGWKYSFTDLPKYNEQNELIEYAISEDEVPNYTVEVIGYDVINTYVAKTSIKGVKVWDDNDNKDNTRPESITVNLLKNGVKIKSKVVTEDDAWEYEFIDLVKYNDDGTEIEYTIGEDAVVGYKSEIVGTNIINTYIPNKENNEENNEEKNEQEIEQDDTTISESIKTGDNIWFSISSLITSLGIVAYIGLRKRK